MWHIPFYEFLPTKDREIEMPEKGASSSPSVAFEFIRCGIRQAQEIDFLKYVHTENDHPQIQLEDEHPPPPVSHTVKILTRSDVDDVYRLLLSQDHCHSLFSLGPN